MKLTYQMCCYCCPESSKFSLFIVIWFNIKWKWHKNMRICPFLRKYPYCLWLINTRCFDAHEIFLHVLYVCWDHHVCFWGIWIVSFSFCTNRIHAAHLEEIKKLKNKEKDRHNAELIWLLTMPSCSYLIIHDRFVSYGQLGCFDNFEV